MKSVRISLKFNRYWLLIGGVAAFLLAVYFVAEVLRVPFLSGAPDLPHAAYAAALLGIGLLTADAMLPVPSSLVMTALGVLFGLLVGTLLALIGSILGFVLAFWLGSRSSPFVRRLLTQEEMSRADRRLQKWGILAIIITRPVPILAETTAIVAGASRLPFGGSLLAAVAGLLPVCLAYAWAGSRARGFGAVAIIFLALICPAAIIWAIHKRDVDSRQ